MKLRTILTSTLAAAALSVGVVGNTSPAAAENLRCDSPIGGYNYCRTSTAGGVELRVQHTPNPCYQNDTWGYDGRGIWVANGCSATFHIGRDDGKTAAAVGLGILALGVIGALADNDQQDDHGGYNQPPPPPPQNYPDNGSYPPGGYPPSGYPQGGYQQGYPDDDEDQNIISCDSKNNKYRQCLVPIRHHAELVHQRSRSACRFNKSWGFDRRGIWVKKGCRGDFAIY